MKILMCNQTWFAEEFREAGHEVVTFGHAQHMQVQQAIALMHIDTVLKQLPGGFEPDVILFHDDSAPLIITGLEETSIPTLFYSVDTHHHASCHKYLGHLFDNILVAQRDYIDEFRTLGLEPEWMPLWASRYIEPVTPKDYGAVFVGTLNPKLNPDRVRFFDELKQRADMLCMSGAFWDIFSKSEIVINQTVKGDLNFRVFEAMMSGALLLTEHSGNGLLDLFVDGEHLITYLKGDVADAAQKIATLLADKKRCHEIAECGRAEILEKHLPTHRAKRLLEILGTLRKKTSPLRCFSAFIEAIRLSYLSEEKNMGLTAPALASAFKAAHEAVRRKETMTEEIAIQLAVSCIRYNSIVGSSAGSDFNALLCEQYPEFELFQLARLRGLLNQGNLDQARELAKKISPHEEQKTFLAAEDVMRCLLEQFAVK